MDCSTGFVDLHSVETTIYWNGHSHLTLSESETCLLSVFFLNLCSRPPVEVNNGCFYLLIFFGGGGVFCRKKAAANYLNADRKLTRQNVSEPNPVSSRTCHRTNLCGNLKGISSGSWSWLGGHILILAEQLLSRIMPGVRENKFDFDTLSSVHCGRLLVLVTDLLSLILLVLCGLGYA